MTGWREPAPVRVERRVNSMNPNPAPNAGESFGRLLRRARTAAGLGQQQLAAAVGVDISYISKLENDRLRPPAADTVERLATVLGTASADLLAAAGKLPAGAVDLANPVAIGFLDEAQKMRLTGEEWEQMRHALRGLRAGPPGRKPTGGGPPTNRRSP